ncbi:hypothetical protein AY601_1840 [Pedobacter cryoconitis]|uniref:Uncharacterized protein n=1 Tax=Pedobacter cryoconitis TaxID=188932 RepID=A0A127VC04_9SPHI|nr:hypothetical protein [Pedobacter cryoconitis]AMP98749.1 hypothetical protein AY601_1840 [Pedobacter cryoconitis]
MENQENEMEQKEIINPEQFQAGRAAEEEKLQQEDDSEYTEDEIEFADGEGTQLDEEIDVPEEQELEDDFESDLDGDEFGQEED